jgi:hypothetical protein
VLFVLDFKTHKISSYSSSTKLRRIASIESIQSLLVDKPGNSLLKNSNSNARIKPTKRFQFTPKQKPSESINFHILGRSGSKVRNSQ